MEVKVKKDKDTKNTKRYTGEAGNFSVSVYVKNEDDLAKKDELTVEVKS